MRSLPVKGAASNANPGCGGPVVVDLLAEVPSRLDHLPVVDQRQQL